MAIEKVDKMPEIQRGVRMVFRELVEAVETATEGDVIKFTREDGKKVNSTTVRKMLEKNTKKAVLVQKYDNTILHIKVLSKAEASKEAEEMKKRSEEMKKKLAGKKGA